MTKRELKELIKSVIQEYTGTGAGGGNAGDGGQGMQTRGMEKTQAVGNPNRTRFTRM